MRHFTFRPSFTLSGREFHGLRGWAGKPWHPPLTDVPVTAYLFVAAFDVISAALPDSHAALAHQLFLAATWTLLGGVGVSVLAALTGWADWHYSSEAGTQARRTINAHAITMIVVTVLALTDLIARAVTASTDGNTPVPLVVVSAVAAVLVTLGATMGGSLVYDYGFNIETSGDHPVWHQSEVDVFPGQHAEAAPAGPADGSDTQADPSAAVGL